VKTVVTGGAGFIGSHLVDRLAGDETWGDILVVDNLRRGKRSNLEQHGGNPRILFSEADIRDPEALRQSLGEADTVFHLAAQSNVMGAVVDVDYSFGSNVVGTFNLLKAAKEYGVRRLVFSSSREVYGEARYLPVDEEHPLGSKNTYGASKVAGEMYCQVFHSLFGVETQVLRFSNVYGPRDFDRVIPIWLGRALGGEDLVVYGGSQVIDFVWIDQVVSALVAAARLPAVVPPVNVGSGRGTPILDLAERIISLVGAGSKLDRQPARAAEVARFVARVDRMGSVLGLEPPEDPLFALTSLVESYRGVGGH
jgi:UDP-glucose 4-epimerase